MNITPEDRNLFQEIVTAIRINFSGDCTNEQRQEAIRKLNCFMHFEDADHSLKRSVQLSEFLLREAVPVNDPFLQYPVYYGLQLMTQIVKFKWQILPPDGRSLIFEYCQQFCRTSMLVTCDTWNVSLPIDSPLVLNSLTQLVWEIFCRTYPAEWGSFVTDCCGSHLLVFPAVFLNLSEMLNDMILPKNSTRRKEIIQCLFSERSKIFEGFSFILQLPATGESFQLIQKTLDALESLFQWFYLDESIVTDLLKFYNTRFCSINFDEPKQNSIELTLILSSYECFLSILQRQNVNRLEDIMTQEKFFYSLTPDSLVSHLINQAMTTYLMQANNFANHPSGEKFLLKCIEIIVEILTHCLDLYNRKLDNQRVHDEITGNQCLWGRFLVFVPDLLKKNVLLDEILLKFILYYGRLKLKPEVGEPSTSSVKGGSNDGVDYYTPITKDTHEAFLMNILGVIILHKNEPLSEDKVQSIENLKCSILEEYDAYLELFRTNRAKFISFMISICDNNPNIAREYTKNLMGYMLGPSTIYEKADVVPNWNCFLFMIQTLLPRLTFDDQDVVRMQSHFEKLLNESNNSDHDIDSLTNILSCLSSMSTLYRHFSTELIRYLLQRIFDFALMPDQKISRHASNLFIRLSLERASILIEHFDNLCNYSDQLFRENRISHSQYFSLIEGLIILSNHFKEPEKQEAYILKVVQNIEWTRNNPCTGDSVQFCQAIGLLGPSTQEQEFKMNEFFMNYKGSVRLLTIIFKRINPKIFLSKPSLLSLYDHLSTFFLYPRLLNTWWEYWIGSEQERIWRHVSPVYSEAFFDDMPFKLYSNILQDRRFLFQNRNKLTIMMEAYENSDKSYKEFLQTYSWYIAERFQSLYTDIMGLVSSSLNYLFLCLEQNEDNESLYRRINSILTFAAESVTDMPLIYCYDHLLLLQNLTANFPRNLLCLENSGCIGFINKFIEFFFRRLDTWNIGDKPTFPNDETFEIIIESLYTIFTNKFISSLYTCLNDDSGLKSWIAKFEKHSEVETFDPNVDDNMELIDAMKDCNISTKSSKNNNNNNNANNTTKMIFDLLIKNNQYIVNSLLSLIQWPIQREKTCSINLNLVDSLVRRNIITNMETMSYYFRSILKAIGRTEITDTSVLNLLVKIFGKIYEVMVHCGYSVPFNNHMSFITGSDIHEWNRLATALGNENARIDANRLKIIRKMLECLCKKPVSQLHSVDQPEVGAMFNFDVRAFLIQTPNFELDSSIVQLFNDDSP